MFFSTDATINMQDVPVGRWHKALEEKDGKPALWLFKRINPNFDNDSQFSLEVWQGWSEESWLKKSREEANARHAAMNRM